MGKYHLSKELTNKFAKPLEEVAYRRHCNITDVFRDWVTVSTLSASGLLMAYAGETEVGQERFKRVDEILKKYQCEDVEVFHTLSKNLQSELKENPRDVLGELYMGLNTANSNLGQVFTPFDISELMSQLVWSDEDESDELDLSDYCCGSGAMIIAYHKTVLSKGYSTMDYNCIAQDIDEFCCMMAFLQFEALGISALVYNDDTLARPYGPNHEVNKMYVTTQFFANDYEARQRVKNEDKSA